jgi:hypothetical protein
MDLFRRVNEWVKYLKLQLTAAEVDVTQAKTRRGRAGAAIMVENRGERAVSTQKALVDSDPRFQEQDDLVQEIYGYAKFVEALHSQVDSDLFHLSREITRRSDAERGGRSTRARRYTP